MWRAFFVGGPMSDDTQDLDSLIHRVDPDRWLSSRFIAGAEARANVIALYAFDHELGRAPKVTSNTILGEIRMTWWREALDEIFQDRPVRAHPAAQALAVAVRHHGLPRDPLEAMIDARYRELDPSPMSPAEAEDWALGTAGQASRLAAQVLDPEVDAELALAPGSAWALARRFPDSKPDMVAARAAARKLSMAAFPAVAHAALAPRPGASELSKRLRLILAVAAGRI